MINFLKIYEFFFKSSFNVRWDTELIKQYGRDWYKSALVIKRSWIYWLYQSIFLIWAFLVMLVNVYLANLSIENETIKFIVILLLVSNILFASYSSLKYLIHFKKISGKTNFIEDIDTLDLKSSEWDELFIKFFNQATLNYFLFIALIIFNIINFVFNFDLKSIDNSLYKIWFWILDIWLLSLQATFIQKYRKKMIDLEMDFNIVVKWKILFANQSNMVSDRQNIDWEKIKTIKSSYPSKLLAFFKVGNIEILTEWDQNNLWAMSMFFVNEPDKTVQMITKALDWNFEEDVDIYKNILFNEILVENWYSIQKYYRWESDNVEKIKKLFERKDIEEKLKSKYFNGWFEDKRVVREIYEKILLLYDKK